MTDNYKMCADPNCNRAGQLLPLDEFPRNKVVKSGRTHLCKECTNRRNRAYRQTEAGKVATAQYKGSEKDKARRQRYDQSPRVKAMRVDYFQTPRGKAAVKRYQQSEKGKALAARHAQTPGGKASRRATRARYPERIKARNAVNHAITADKIPHVSTQKCTECSNPAQDYHHYKGYAPENWLDVIPVCKDCHTRLG